MIEISPEAQERVESLIQLAMDQCLGCDTLRWHYRLIEEGLLIVLIDSPHNPEDPTSSMCGVNIELDDILKDEDFRFVRFRSHSEETWEDESIVLTYGEACVEVELESGKQSVLLRFYAYEAESDTKVTFPPSILN